MSDPLIGTAISGLGLGLEIFDRIRQKLVAQPDPAAERLCAVFDQLRGMYSSLDAELSAFSGMVFWPEMERREYAQRFEQLSRLSPEPLRARFAEAQAHCSTIGNIYDRFLKSWFERLLNKTEQDELARLFDRLNNADEGFVRALDAIAYWLGGSSREIRHLLEQEKWNEIEKQHRIDRKKADALRNEISKTWSELAKLRGQFVRTTGATAV